MGMSAFEALRIPSPNQAPNRGDEGKDRPKTTPRATNSPENLDQIPKKRERSGSKTLLEQFLTKAIDRRGNEKVKFDPKGGMSQAAVESMFKSKALLERGLLTRLSSEFGGTALRQTQNLARTTLENIGGSKPSSKRELATWIAKAAEDLGRLGASQTSDDSKRFFTAWTWLTSNGFVLGDENAHMDTLPKDIQRRAALVKKFDARRPELDAIIQDRIGEELDLVIRWARARHFNITLPERIRTARTAKKDLNQPEFNKVSVPKFPEKGLVAFLASKFPHNEELHHLAGTAPERNPDRKAFLARRAEIIKRLATDPRLPYDPYIPVSTKRRGEIAQARKAATQTLTRSQKREATKEDKHRQAEQAKNSEAQRLLLDREKSEERLKLLRPMIETAAQRTEKAKLLLKAIDVDLRRQPGPLRSIAIRIDVPQQGRGEAPKTLLKLYEEFIAEAKKFDVKDDRRALDKLVGARRTAGPILTQQEFDRLRGKFLRLGERHWKTLEKHINQIIRGIHSQLSEPQRKTFGLNDVVLDALTTRDMPQVIANLRRGFGFIQGGLEHRSDENLRFLRGEVLPKLRSRLNSLAKDHPEHQSLDSRVKNLVMLTHQDNTSVITNKLASMIQRQVDRYRSMPEIK